uniref:Melanocortin-2 receptor accessory protein n=1 Tax=Sciurus vulgaris TaxID=55149 RepID=A0A8D2CPY9_SCIVU
MANQTNTSAPYYSYEYYLDYLDLIPVDEKKLKANKHAIVIAFWVSLAAFVMLLFLILLYMSWSGASQMRTQLIMNLVSCSSILLIRVGNGPSASPSRSWPMAVWPGRRAAGLTPTFKFGIGNLREELGGSGSCTMWPGRTRGCAPLGTTTSIWTEAVGSEATQNYRKLVHREARGGPYTNQRTAPTPGGSQVTPVRNLPADAL